jgi:putative heme-binding domain-containing protein
LEHSLTYALIEIGHSTRLREALTTGTPGAQRSALVALDQLDANFEASVAIEKLRSEHEPVRAAAWWVIDRHPEWAPMLATYFREHWSDRSAIGESPRMLTERLRRFATDISIQDWMAELLEKSSTPPELRSSILEIVSQTRFESVGPMLRSAIWAELKAQGPSMIVVRAFDQVAQETLSEEELERLRGLASRAEDDESRLAIVSAISKRSRHVDDSTVQFLCDRISIQTPPVVRGAAVDLLVGLSLTGDQRQRVAQSLRHVGPLDLKKLVDIFGSDSDVRTRTEVVAGLDQSMALASLTSADLRAMADRFGQDHRESIEELIKRVEQLNAQKAERFAMVLSLMPLADERRGQLVFQGSKASCSACHRAGYLGGDMGPDLSRIGEARTEADLIESILLPSATLVRSFEPTIIVTSDGKSHNGLIRAETDTEITLAMDATRTVHISKNEIETRVPGTVSVMPSGIDQSLTAQELADVVKFLKSAR